MGIAPAELSTLDRAATVLPVCERCGDAVRRRRRSEQAPSLCAACDQRERRSAYFREYYETHKDRILAKNRRWAKDNKDRIVRLRQARRTQLPSLGEDTRRCLDCGTAVTRAERCRKCYIRHRYASDPTYRTRRLATTRRWLERRQTSSSVRPRDLAPAGSGVGPN